MTDWRCQTPSDEFPDGCPYGDQCDQGSGPRCESAVVERCARAEARFLSLMADAGLPAPDEIGYGATSMTFLWTDRKVAVVVDFDDADIAQIVPI